MEETLKNRITGRTRLICLLGSPVAHSISPAMHNEAFSRLGLDFAYLAFDVGTKELRQAVDGLVSLGARGWNLTMPDKNLMAEYCSRLSGAAALTGAVNTVVNENGTLTGYTTDGVGYMKAAALEGCDLKGRTMTILGGGGAAAAIIAQAAIDGAGQIHIFNRRSATFLKLEKLADEINARTSCRVTVQDLADKRALHDSIQESLLLTNATNVGMAPDTDGCLIEDPDVLRRDLFVSDIIYNPRQTRLLQMAGERGCRTFNGLPMLLYQGAAAFKLWTGEEMPVDIIREKYFRGEEDE